MEEMVKQSILNNISPEVMVESIKRQLSNYFGEEIKYNQLNIFSEKIEDLREQEADNAEALESINKMEEEVFSSVLETILERFNLELDTDNVILKNTTEVLYEFFVYNYRENLKSLIVGYILKNRRDLQRTSANALSKTDIRIIYARKQYKDTKDAYIYGNIHNIIESIANSDFEESDFLKYMSYGDDLLINEISRLLKSQCLVSKTGTFATDFLSIFREKMIYDIGPISVDVLESLVTTFQQN